MCLILRSNSLLTPDSGADHFIGHYADLLRNWYSLLAVAGLTKIERLEAEVLFAAKVGIYGTPMA